MLSMLEILSAGAAVALMGGVLSVFVVTKRLAFVGQGVSHAAFGGFGLAVFMGLSAGTLGFYGVVLASCVVAAWGIAGIGASKKVDDDSAIGIVLVAAMSVGALLVYVRSRQPNPGIIPSWEEFLFGSVLFVSGAEAVGAWVVCAAVCGVVWWVRRRALLWAMDEEGARAIGVRTGLVRALMLTLLAVAIVVSMRLVGVVLATALLILPGAIALRVSERLRVVVVVSIVSALVGTVGGLWMSLERDLLPGPSVVVVLVGMLLVAAGLRGVWPERSLDVSVDEGVQSG